MSTNWSTEVAVDAVLTVPLPGNTIELLRAYLNRVDPKAVTIFLRAYIAR